MNFAIFRKNMALVHFYFVNTQFTRNTKSEIYGFSEFLCKYDEQPLFGAKFLFGDSPNLKFCLNPP